jgi:GH43 family beta-xylosidase
MGIMELATMGKSRPFMTIFSTFTNRVGSFFTSPDGKEIWNVYHATSNSAGACNGARYTMAQKVNWNANGSPNFGTAARLGTVLTGPSGE